MWDPLDWLGPNAQAPAADGQNMYLRCLPSALEWFLRGACFFPIAGSLAWGWIRNARPNPIFSFARLTLPSGRVCVSMTSPCGLHPHFHPSETGSTASENQNNKTKLRGGNLTLSPFLARVSVSRELYKQIPPIRLLSEFGHAGFPSPTSPSVAINRLQSLRQQKAWPFSCPGHVTKFPVPEKAAQRLRSAQAAKPGLRRGRPSFPLRAGRIRSPLFFLVRPVRKEKPISVLFSTRLLSSGFLSFSSPKRTSATENRRTEVNRDRKRPTSSGSAREEERNFVGLGVERLVAFREKRGPHDIRRGEANARYKTQRHTSTDRRKHELRVRENDLPALPDYRSLLRLFWNPRSPLIFTQPLRASFRPSRISEPNLHNGYAPPNTRHTHRSANPSSTATPQETIIPFADLPDCAANCGPLFDANGACVPPITTEVDESCFCNHDAVAGFKTSAEGVCDEACTGDDGKDALVQIQNWFAETCDVEAVNASDGDDGDSDSSGDSGSGGTRGTSSTNVAGSGQSWFVSLPSLPFSHIPWNQC